MLTDFPGRHVVGEGAPPKRGEIYGSVLENDTFLLLTDFAGRHVAG